MFTPAAGEGRLMKYGVAIFATDETIDVPQLAVAAEQRGFESLFLPEHTHIPASRRTPYAGGGELQRYFYHLVDPLVSLAGAAVLTKTIKLGTGVILIPEHDPIVLAKELATLDRISNGRLIFGVGAGWIAEEAENHVVTFNTRFGLMRERVEAIKAIWTQEDARYHGKFVNFDPIWCHPKPLQKPHPPVLMGGRTSASRRRAVAYCDGWIPTAIGARELLPAIADLRQQARAAGRNPDSVSVTSFGASAQPDELKLLADAGVERAVFWLPSAGADRVLPELDRLASALKL
ncbi:MAG TPA: LLM class F420-dependent oxidoreductase [Candidatus Binataceae bacterium]